MKKIIAFLTIFSIAVLFFTGCGSSSSKNEDSSDKITIKGADGKEYESYREACRAGDFEAAHKFLDKMYKMREEGHHTYAEEAENYIFNYEVNALISQNDKEANDRVIYLLNEFTIVGEREPGSNLSSTSYGTSCAEFNKKCDKILDISISLKNRDMAKKIIPLYKEDEKYDEKSYLYYTYEMKESAQKKYDEAVKNGAFD